jgi:Tfp pilus assembly protein PilN
MTVDWQIASLGWDDSPRIDLNTQRREEQRRVFVRARRKALMLLCLTVYAGAVLAPATVSVIGMHAEAQSVGHNIVNTDGQILQLQQSVAQLDARESAWRGYQDQQRRRRSWGDALATVAAACPANVYLDQLRVDGVSSKVTITGTANDVTFVNNFVTGLQRSSAFQSVVLTETSTDPTLAQQRMRFKIDALCNLPLGN